MDVKLRDYQIDAVQRMHNGCILCGGVGSGKSITALAYYKDAEPYIITTSKKRDSGEWLSDAKKIGVKVRCVDSWNNIKKYINVKDSAFIFDEQRVSGKGRWAKEFIKIAKKNQWILLSATPGDRWDDYATVFIANGFVKNRSEWYKDFCIFQKYCDFPKIIGYQREDILEKMKKKILVNMDYRSEKERIYKTVPIKADTFEERFILKNRRTQTGLKPFETLGAAVQYARMYCPRDDDKYEKLVNIINKYKKIIVFYNFIYEKDIIRNACRDKAPWDEEPYYDIAYAECSGQRHDPIPDQERWVYAVNYGSGAEGWNCASCNCIVFFSLNYSYRIMEQQAGRIDRLNSEHDKLYYYYFVTDMEIDKRIVECLKMKKDFNERMLNE